MTYFVTCTQKLPIRTFEGKFSVARHRSGRCCKTNHLISPNYCSIFKCFCVKTAITASAILFTSIAVTCYVLVDFEMSKVFYFQISSPHTWRLKCDDKESYEFTPDTILYQVDREHNQNNDPFV